jgi:YD repeat-containing protein
VVNGSTLALSDSNGNQIKVSGSQIFDTLSATTAVLTMSGTPSAPPVKYAYTNPQGTTSYVTVNYTLHTVQTDFACPGIGDYNPTGQANNIPLVDTIVMPDNSQYSFTYEITPNNSGAVTGRLASITLPTGGTITYTYTGGNNGIICADGSAAGLQRVVSPGGTWTYGRSGSGSTWTTTVTNPSPDNSVTTINFEKDSATSAYPTNNFYETQRTVKQGGTTLLATTITCYNANNTPASCYNTPVKSPISEVAVFRYLPNASGSQAETDTLYDGYGLVASVSEYDFGSAQVGPLLRETVTAYNRTLGNNIVDRPSSVKVYDGGPNLKAQTTYTYDEGTPATSGATQHIRINGSRGNLTTVSAQSTTAATLYRKFSYYDTGMLNQTGDVTNSNTPLTNPTTYNYSSSATSCDFAFPTSIAEPMSLSRSTTWDCNGGVPLTVTDENQQPTTFSSYDSMWRLTDVKYPDGGETQTTYNISSDPPNIQVNQKINSTNWMDRQTNLDGLGRAVQQQFTSDPNGTVHTDTVYDAFGRVASVSNPYYTTSDLTYGITQYSYDALSRATTITNPDNSTRLMYYSGPWSNIQDEGNGTSRAIRLYKSDGLGRMVTVCEVASAQLGTGGTPVGCAPDGTFGNPGGFLTTDVYDPLGNITSMAQGAQTRTYSYDMLGRITSEANPEMWGGVTYSYDAATAGDLYQRSQPKQNLGSGNGNW